MVRNQTSKLKTASYTDWAKLSRPDLYPILVIVMFWFVLLCNPTNNISSFDQEDDHLLTGFNLAYKQGSTFGELLKGELQSDHGQRFRPLWVAYRLMEVRLFGNCYACYSILNTLVLCVASLLIYFTGRLLKMGRVMAVLLAIMTFLGPQLQAYIWRAPQEALATLILAAMLFITTRSTMLKARHWQLPSVFVLGVLLSLTKESFVLTFPALAIWKVGLYASIRQLGINTSVRRSIWWILGFLLNFALGIGMVLTFAGTSMGYVGIEPARNLTSYLDPASYLYKTAPGWLFVLGLGLFVFISRKEYTRPGWQPRCLGLFLLLFTLAWTTPQIILFAKSGFYPRYLLPSVLAFWLSFFLFVSRAKIFSPSVYNQLRFLLFLAVLIQGYVSITFLVGFGKWRQNWTNVILDARQHVTPDSKVLVIADPSLDYGYAKNMFDFLTGYAGLDQNNLSIMFDPPPPYQDDGENRLHKTGVLGPLYRRHIVTDPAEFKNFDLITVPKYQADKPEFQSKYSPLLESLHVTSGPKFQHYFRTER